MTPPLANSELLKHPSCRWRKGEFCLVATEHFGKPVQVTNQWCNGTCKQHRGPYDGRVLTPKERLFFVLRMFLRNYAGGSTDFVQKVSRSYSRPVNLKLPLVEYKKIKAALPANHKILLTGSLLTKDAPHKDYDIVMLVDALEDSITLKETLPKTIDGVKCDYFFLVRPSHSFYAATLDVENKILYTSSWFNLHLASLPEGVTVFSCDTSGAAELLKDTFHDRNLSVQQGISYMRAVLFGNKVSDEVKIERDATCSMCPFMRVSTDAKTQYCGICGCNTQPKDGVSMTAYEENLPHWGCKHPKRKEGQGWKR